jgi:hypothetical protein
VGSLVTRCARSTASPGRSPRPAASGGSAVAAPHRSLTRSTRRPVTSSRHRNRAGRRGLQVAPGGHGERQVRRGHLDRVAAGGGPQDAAPHHHLAGAAEQGPDPLGRRLARHRHLVGGVLGDEERTGGAERVAVLHLRRRAAGGRGRPRRVGGGGADERAEALSGVEQALLPQDGDALPHGREAHPVGPDQRRLSRQPIARGPLAGLDAPPQGVGDRTVLGGPPRAVRRHPTPSVRSSARASTVPAGAG